ncbi:metallophosphoesterase [Streptomyces sp. WMMC500]|uniref:metallophosphoesterase n=1 Tax=Streptomyces sp. WMMC500 TaxID=3015154 RepID=UPI00248B013F|nr:metallophosphoesterase [Streptomyces sp. WMMC500]WBB64495.1 metallophosphoesterase [Streptomyces sp. WMMC500]
MLLLVAGAHWYVWRRLVRDTMRRGGWPRRLATSAVVLLPLMAVATLASERAGAPMVVQRTLAWPGLMWLALLLYLLLALAVGEVVRPVLLRVLERRARGREQGAAGGAGAAAPVAEAEREAAVAALAQQVAATEAADGEPVAGGGGAGATGATGPLRLEPVTGLVDAGSTAGAGSAAGPGGGREAGGAAGSGGSGGVEGAGGVADRAASDDRPGAVDSAASDGLSGRPGPRTAADVSRRLFVARTVAIGATAVAAGTVAYGAYGVLGRAPRVKNVTVPLAKLPASADGYRIAVVSDIHLGPVLGRGHTQRIVDTINAQRPDLVAIVGDLVDGSVDHLGNAAEPLGQLEARDGSYFVTGNHEYFAGADGAAEWLDHLRELGLHPLENARTELAGFDLAGVNDVSGEDVGRAPDFARALGDRDTSRASVLMAHQPVMIHDAVDHGVDLQLSGHTHGGQMWPATYVAQAANPTLAGLERYGDTQLYVTRGAGAWGPPVRVGAPSDITLVRLASPRA